MPLHAHAPENLNALLQAEPDLVDRIFDYILAEFPQIGDQGGKLKAAVRAEFKGEECYIAGRPATARQETVSQVLSLFNGRNSTEIARRLGISRRSVYRIIKQPGGLKKCDSFPGNGTAATLP